MLLSSGRGVSYTGREGQWRRGTMYFGLGLLASGKRLGSIACAVFGW